jgi:hypothetical protein
LRRITCTSCDRTARSCSSQSSRSDNDGATWVLLAQPVKPGFEYVWTHGDRWFNFGNSGGAAIYYSGVGLDRARAHLHFEVNLLLNEHFGEWRDTRHTRWSATHGRFHGYNLAGVSPVEVLLQSRDAAPFSMAELFAEARPDVTVHVPAGPPPELLSRYPWLCQSCEGDPPPEWAMSWEVGLTRAGLPVRIEPSNRRVETLQLGRVDGFVTADYLHSRLLTRRGGNADLTTACRELLSLLFTRPGMVPRW